MSESIKKYPIPFRGLSYTLKLRVMESHYTLNNGHDENCLVCLFFNNLVNQLPELNNIVTLEMVDKTDTIPEHLKYYNGNPKIKDDFERYLNKISD